MRCLKYLVPFVVFLFAVSVPAQQKQVASKPATAAQGSQAKADPSTDPPVLSDKQAKDIAMLERNLVQEQSQLQQLQQQYQTISGKMRADNADLQKKLNEAQIPNWILDPVSLLYSKAPDQQKPQAKK